MSARRLPRKVLAVGAPSVWMAYFGAVYLVSEAACNDGHSGGEVLGVDVLVLAVLAITLVASVITAGLTWLALPVGHHVDPDAEDEDRHDFALLGVLMGLVFLVSTVVVAVPFLVVGPC